MVTIILIAMTLMSLVMLIRHASPNTSEPSKASDGWKFSSQQIHDMDMAIHTSMFPCVRNFGLLEVWEVMAVLKKPQVGGNAR